MKVVLFVLLTSLFITLSRASDVESKCVSAETESECMKRCVCSWCVSSYLNTSLCVEYSEYCVYWNAEIVSVASETEFCKEKRKEDIIVICLIVGVPILAGVLFIVGVLCYVNGFKRRYKSLCCA